MVEADGNIKTLWLCFHDDLYPLPIRVLEDYEIEAQKKEYKILQLERTAVLEEILCKGRPSFAKEEYLSMYLQTGLPLPKFSVFLVMRYS